CNEIVMARDAVLADFSYLPADQVDDVKTMLLPLVKEQGYPPLLFEAALSKDLVLYRVKTKQGEDLLIAAKHVENPAWHTISRLDRAPNSFLKITPPLAGEFGVAPSTDIASLDDLHAHYGLESNRVRIARDDWLEQVAE